MTTEHNNFLTVSCKQVALLYQTAENSLKDAVFDSIPTSCDNQHLLRLSYLVRVINGCPNSKIDHVMSSFGFLL